MPTFSQQQTGIIRDLADAGGTLLVPAEAIGGAVIQLCAAGLVRAEVIGFKEVQFLLTEKGWQAVHGLPEKA